MTRSKKKFYAVARGKNPGIYHEWSGEDGAEAQVKEFPNARYQGFFTIKEAREWLKEFGILVSVPEPPELEEEIQQELEKGKIIIYTDGGCINNPGPGGYGVVLLSGGKRKELSGGYRLTTNNRMELMAVIQGLKALKFSCSVMLFSDSTYVVDGIEKGWARRWRKKGWMRSPTQPAENADLWEQLLDLCDTHTVEFSWVRGHTGQPENERCDQLAKQAALDEENLLQDTAYENGRTKGMGPLFQKFQEA